MTFKVGQKVQILTGLRSFKVGTGQVTRLSATGKRLTVVRNGLSAAFYRNADNTRYVKDPGAGLFGSMLNDYITIPKEETDGGNA